MSKKLPDKTNKGNVSDDGLQALDVHRVSSVDDSTESEFLEEDMSDDEAFKPTDRVEIRTIEADEVAGANDESESEIETIDEQIDESDNGQTLDDVEEPDSLSAVNIESAIESSEDSLSAMTQEDEESEGMTTIESTEVNYQEGDQVIKESVDVVTVASVDEIPQESEQEDLTASDDIGVADDAEYTENEEAVSEEEASDIEDDVAEDGVQVIAKYPYGLTSKPRLTAGLRNVLLVLFVLWIGFVFVAPFILPQGLDTPNLDLLTGEHLLGTDSVGRDVLSTTLKAGRTSLIYALIPTLISLFGILLTYSNWSDPSSTYSRAYLMRPMPFTVISIIASFAMGLFLPRTWVYFIIVAFLSLVLWLREAFAVAHYIKAYRQARPNQFSYYLGARELDNIRYTYGHEVRAAFLNGVLNVFLRAYLIISVLPFTDNSLSVPQRADWASHIILPLRQGVSILDPNVLPHFIGWAIPLVLVILIILLNLRVARRQKVLSTMRMRANHWRAGDEV